MKGSIKEALVVLHVLALSNADEELQELAESSMNKLTALTTERDALADYVKRVSAWINNLPDGGDYELVDEADALLAPLR